MIVNAFLIATVLESDDPCSKLLIGIAHKEWMRHHRRKTKRNLCAALLMVRWIEDGGNTRTELPPWKTFLPQGLACTRSIPYLPKQRWVSVIQTENIKGRSSTVNRRRSGIC